MLAGMGADVIKVEPPGGSRSRLLPPLAGDAASTGLPFQAYNRGKRSVVLDLEDASGQSDFLALAATADFVFENAGPELLTQPAWDSMRSKPCGQTLCM